MDTNTAKLGKVIYPELSYRITGLLFAVHNELGQFAREKQYGDLLENKLKDERMPYAREISISNTGNIVDFIYKTWSACELS